MTHRMRKDRSHSRIPPPISPPAQREESPAERFRRLSEEFKAARRGVQENAIPFLEALALLEMTHARLVDLTAEKQGNVRAIGRNQAAKRITEMLGLERLGQLEDSIIVFIRTQLIDAAFNAGSDLAKKGKK